MVEIIIKVGQLMTNKYEDKDGIGIVIHQEGMKGKSDCTDERELAIMQLAARVMKLCEYSIGHIAGELEDQGATVKDMFMPPAEGERYCENMGLTKDGPLGVDLNYILNGGLFNELKRDETGQGSNEEAASDSAPETEG